MAQWMLSVCACSEHIEGRRSAEPTPDAADKMDRLIHVQLDTERIYPTDSSATKMDRLTVPQPSHFGLSLSSSSLLSTPSRTPSYRRSVTLPRRQADRPTRRSLHDKLPCLFAYLPVDCSSFYPPSERSETGGYTVFTFVCLSVCLSLSLSLCVCAHTVQSSTVCVPPTTHQPSPSCNRCPFPTHVHP